MNTFDPIRVMAIDPASRGFGFALLEGPERLVDWGFRNATSDKDARSIGYLNALLALYKPDVLVLEAYDARRSRRSVRIQKLARAFGVLAKKHEMLCVGISGVAVRAAFPSCPTKYDIARALVTQFPETQPWCPPRRKIWLSEDSRINIFDALALACTYLQNPEQQQEIRAA
jgi:Holliday junction resolvasome RuvABC endonuclease subunit